MEENKKNKWFQIRVTEKEKSKIENKAKRLGYKSTSNYILNVCLNKQIKSKIDTKGLLQLQRIGVNVNQIARILNTYEGYETVVGMKSEVKEIRKLLEEYRNIINDNDK